jgi:hypothetical protein
LSTFQQSKRPFQERINFIRQEEFIWCVFLSFILLENVHEVWVKRFLGFILCFWTKL